MNSQFSQIYNNNQYMQAQCLSPYTPISSKLAIKKDFFIQSRKDDINNFYHFYPKPIGKGGYGVVYQAKLKQPPYSDRVVKVINKKYVKNPDVLKNQIHILKKLDHPHIVKLYQSFEDQNYLYLVEDLCEGGELFDRLDERGSFNQSEARNIFVQMLKTVKYLHLMKICHRDLKAQNFLFLRKDGNTIQLIDFGLAFQWSHDMHDELHKLGANKIVGTAYYVSPEVLARDYNEKCDLWSLGILLHIITTATAPFSGENDLQITTKIKNSPYQQNQNVTKLSLPLRDLISKILVPVQQRISLDDIFNHPWINSESLHPNLYLDYGKMKKFSSYFKLKAVFLAFIATQLPAKQNEVLGELFKYVDKDNDGFLSVNQIQNSLHNQSLYPSYNELHSILKSMDMDKNGKINYNQFVASCLDEDYCHRDDYLRYIFQYFDKDHSGKISRSELQVQIQKMGIETPERLINQIMRESDLDKDDQISYQQFVISIQQNI